MSCNGLQFLKIYEAGKYSFWQYCYLIWFYGPVNKKKNGSPITDYVNFFFLLSWNILLLLFTKQLWCCQYMYKFPLHVSLGSVCMEGGRSQYQENPRGWDNFSLGLHAEILVRVVPRQGTLIHRNSQKRIEIHQSQTMKFWTCWSKLLFLKRNAKMIDGSEETQRQFGFWTSEFACLWKA